MLQELDLCLHSAVLYRNTAVLQNQSGQTPTMTTHDQQVRISTDKILNVPCVTLSSVNSVTSIALHGPPTLMCLCNRSWLSQQEPDPAIL